jgi:hypothetical protein
LQYKNNAVLNYDAKNYAFDSLFQFFLDCTSAEQNCSGVMPNMMRIFAASRNLSFVFKQEIPERGFE